MNEGECGGRDKIGVHCGSLGGVIKVSLPTLFRPLMSMIRGLGLGERGEGFQMLG